MKKQIQPTLIGKFCQVRDNSWAVTLGTGENPMLALTLLCKDKERPICEIVSEPYKMGVETCNGIKEYEFITVMYDGLLHIVLNRIDLVEEELEIEVWIRITIG